MRARLLCHSPCALRMHTQAHMQTRKQSTSTLSRSGREELSLSASLISLRIERKRGEAGSWQIGAGDRGDFNLCWIADTKLREIFADVDLNFGYSHAHTRSAHFNTNACICMHSHLYSRITDACTHTIYTGASRHFRVQCLWTRASVVV